MTAPAVESRVPRRNDLAGWLIFGGLAMLALGYVTFVKPRLKGNVGVADPSVGTSYRDFEALPLLNGARPFTSQNYAGHVTLIAYWGPWCPPCRREMPHLLEIAKQLQADPRFQFVSVACPADLDSDSDEFLRATEQFLQHLQSAVPTYTLPQSVLIANYSPTIDPALQLSFPTTLVIDGSGRIRGKWVGYDPAYPGQISDALVATLAQMPARTSAAAEKQR